MSRSFGFPVAGLAVLATVGLTGAAGHSEMGEYKTRVTGDRLFVNGGRILRCDLFFSAPGSDTVVAPKGSALNQSVPPVVWQYSGLLPVSDYLRTVAIHSVASGDKIRPWQDVQKTFYDGLLVEGASHTDAKIAFAGAYSFAPRWPLVELVEVAEDKVIHPDSVLYSVEYIQPTRKGMTLEAYRKLALEILNAPENVTLSDIRGVIDAVDILRGEADDRAPLGGIGQTENGLSAISLLDKVMPSKQQSSGGIVVGDNGSLMDSAKQMVASASGQVKSAEKAEQMKAAEDKARVLPADVDLPILTENPESQDVDNAEGAVDLATVSVTDGVQEEMVKGKILPIDELFYDDRKGAGEKVSDAGAEPAAMDGEPEDKDDAMVFAALSAKELMQIDGPEDEWVLLADGTLVLRNIAKQVAK